MPDAYSILGLSRRASSAEIKAAYRKLVKRSHPDVNAGDEDIGQRIRDINLAYETLSDPELRAAHDLELTRQRARVRRIYWSAAASGAGAGVAATIMLTVTLLTVTVTRIQHAEIRQSPSGEPTLPVKDIRSESLATNLPAADNANLRSAELREPDGGNVPWDLGSARLPEAIMEPPASAGSKIAGAPLGNNSETQTLDEPAARPSPQSKGAPREQVASASPQALPSEVPAPETPREFSAPVQDTRAPTKLASATPPKAGTKLGPAEATASQKPKAEPERRDTRPNHAMIKRMNKKSPGRTNAIEAAAILPPNRGRDLEREPRLVSSHTMALRWPSADEPFVNVGGASR